MKTLIIIPTYNERENIATLVAGILSAGSPELDVLIVDDASPDGTGELADALASSHPGRIVVCHRPAKSGIGSAYVGGFHFALEHGYAAVCQMDADGSHDASSLPALIDAVAHGEADVAIGSRRVPGGTIEGWGAHRHLMSASAAAFARTLLGLATLDVTAGFRCYRADVVRSLLAQDIRSDGYAFQEETLFHCERLRWRIRELPIVFRDRTAGNSKLSWREVPRFFQVVIRLRREFGPVRHG